MLNKVQLIGRLGKKPEINYIQPDVPVARYTLATNESYKNKDGEWVEQTEWHNIVSWRNNAKYAESYLDKGMLIYIEGKLQTRTWEKDGVVRYSTEIITNMIRLLEKKANSEFSGNIAKTSSPVNNETISQTISNEEDPFANVSPELSADNSDDLPF